MNKISVYVNDEEKQKIMIQAHKELKSISRFLKHLALNHIKKESD